VIARLLAGMLVAWPLAQAGVVASDLHGGPGQLSALVRIVGSRVCHQRPERSFHTKSVQWPVCGRCTGIYLGAAIGGVAGCLAGVRRRLSARTATVVLLTAASAPTLATWFAEWVGGVPIMNLTRAMAAVPLGAARAAVAVAMAAPSTKFNRVN
jgi:uncharacterized membrane protein